MFRVQYRHDVKKVEGFGDESSCPHQYTVLCLVTDFDTPKYRLQLAEQICALFERFYLLLTRQLFMFTDPLTSPRTPHPRLPRASPISALHCLRHFLFPPRVTFLTHWEISRGKFYEFLLLNLPRGKKRRIAK